MFFPVPQRLLMFPLERFWEDRNNSRKSKVSTNLNFTAELSFYPSPNHHTHRYSLFRNIFQRSVTLIEYRWESRKEINKRSSEEHKSAIRHQEGSCLTQKGADQTFTPLSSLVLWVFPSPLLFYTMLWVSREPVWLSHNPFADVHNICDADQFLQQNLLHQCRGTTEQPSGLKSRELWFVLVRLKQQENCRPATYMRLKESS